MPCSSLAGGKSRYTVAVVSEMQRGAYLILWLCLQEEGRVAGDNERITYSQP